jgi:transposase InsO family protein
VRRELSGLLGEQVTWRAVRRNRHRYLHGGVRALVDGRLTRPSSPTGRVDPRVVEAVSAALAGERDRSTGTRDRLRFQVERALRDRYGAEAPAMPSKATFNRLVAGLDVGRHSFGAATTRRSQAAKPEGLYTVGLAVRPGQQVHVDSTPFDVLAMFDDGIARRCELVAAVDLATRTICAAVLRPVGIKAVDASLMLARMLVPEPMRPGWNEAAAITASRLPFRSLQEIDARMNGAAAKPAIVPELISSDRGRVYLSEAFIAACTHLGISVQPSRPRTSPDNAIIEATWPSINSLFSQYVKGYVGRDPAHRGRNLEADGLWSLAQLQDMLDQWVILGWQSRPHTGLTSPDSSRVLSPNEMYARLVAAAGYVPLMLSGDDYVALLPCAWRVVNDYGINLGGRTYDAKDLNPLRRQHSGVAAKRGLWKVHFDPYDLSLVWVADHRRGGFIATPWTHLPMVAAPFADYTWRHAQRLAAARPGDGADQQTRTARALAELLEHAGRGPGKDLEPAAAAIVARTREGAAAHRPAQLPDLPEPPTRSEHAPVAPFGLFDAEQEARIWLRL